MSGSNNGTPTYFSMEITEGFDGGTGASIVQAQKLLLDHTDTTENPAHSAFDVIGVQLRIHSRSGMDAEIDSFAMPRADNDDGAWQKMGFGCERKLTPVELTFEWPRALVTPDTEHNDEYNIAALAGASGTGRITLNDGGYWQGSCKIVKAPLLEEVPAEPAVGQLTVVFVGGSLTDPAYTKPAALLS